MALHTAYLACADVVGNACVKLARSRDAENL